MTDEQECRFCGEDLDYCGHDPDWTPSRLPIRPKRHETPWNAHLMRDEN